MPTTYTSPTRSDEIRGLIEEIMRDHHPQLHEAGVRVGIVYADNDTGPAVKHAGYPAIATIKVISLRDRVTKYHDAEILLDRRIWEESRIEHRRAILDHELSHIALVPLPPSEVNHARQRDANTPWWKIDDLGRPKLQSVKGDWSAGDGFRKVVQRHQGFAVEFLNLQQALAIAEAAASDATV